MMNTSNQTYQDRLKSIRAAFQQGIDFDRAQVRNVILESWERSRNSGLKMASIKNQFLSAEQLQQRIAQRKRICDVAFPILANLYEFTNGSNLLSVFCDEEGWVLKMVGKSFFNFIPKEYRLTEGVSRNEKMVGTNGIGTVLVTHKPMQVIGLEHYYPTYHDYACSGAPVFDADDKIVGVLCLAGSTSDSKIHTLGLAIAIAAIISSELKIQKHRLSIEAAYHEVNNINNRLQVIFDTVSSGVMMLDKDLTIIHANVMAEKILCCKKGALEGQHINSYFDNRVVNPKNIARGVEDKYLLYEKDTVQIELLVTIQSFATNEYVLVFDTTSALQKKIRTVAGMEAFFSFSDILGQSDALCNAIELATIAAKTPSNVLLLGESGTGKELFAHAIHNASARKKGPFIPINCGAIPKTLIESELFGYESGSFTGAKREGCPGKFELANGGTIFLDEIGDMPFDVQSTLLRVLQTREIMRVGGTRAKQIDVRIIAATNKNLQEAMENHSFRRDLFYRLNVFSINIPPLCDRKGDIRLLADYFSTKYAQIAQKKNPLITEGAYSILENCRWEGNVRELENVMERAVYVADSVIDERCLPDYLCMVKQDGEHGRNAQEAFAGVYTASYSAHHKVDEKANIIGALQAVAGNVPAAAIKLGISKRTLYRRIKKYRIAKDKIYS